MTNNPQRCEHYPVCWFVNTNHRCINDNPDDIPCIFDTRKSIDFTERASHSTAASEREQVLDEIKEIIDGAISGLYKGTEDVVSAHARHKALSWVNMKIAELRKQGEQR